MLTYPVVAWSIPVKGILSVSSHDCQMSPQVFLQGKIPVYIFQSLILFYIKHFLHHFGLLKYSRNVTICE